MPSTWPVLCASWAAQADRTARAASAVSPSRQPRSLMPAPARGSPKIVPEKYLIFGILLCKNIRLFVLLLRENY